MNPHDFRFSDGALRVVGSIARVQDAAGISASSAARACDIVEIRLDAENGVLPDAAAWHGLAPFPLLFTARRSDEGGSGSLSAERRAEFLESALGSAALVDLEVASIPEMSALIGRLVERNIPWIASFHDFQKLPADAVLAAAASKAKAAGAAVFKAAALLHSPDDIARLARFQLADHGIPVATMGMGVFAPVSRLLCAQCGSVLNYGYLGKIPTAPGQWSAEELKDAIARLPEK